MIDNGLFFFSVPEMHSPKKKQQQTMKKQNKTKEDEVLNLLEPLLSGGHRRHQPVEWDIVETKPATCAEKTLQTHQ